MYSARYKRLLIKEFISEEESDKVIASLLEYEEELSFDYARSVKELLKKLIKLHEQYTENIKKSEETISKWTHNIHANYIQKNTIRTLPDGTKTHRLETPVPVHIMPYAGSDLSMAIEKFLNDKAVKKVVD